MVTITAAQSLLLKHGIVLRALAIRNLGRARQYGFLTIGLLVGADGLAWNVILSICSMKMAIVGIAVNNNLVSCKLKFAHSIT